MDQFGGSGERIDGSPCCERSGGSRRAASEMAGTPPRRGCPSRGSESHAARTKRIPKRKICEVAAAGRIRLRKGNSQDVGRKISQNGAARTICGLEVGRGSS